MAITHWPQTERPREKLIRQGANALSDAELLAILLRTGVKGKTALDLARDLIQHFGGLTALLSATLLELQQIRGIGKAKYASLQAIVTIAQRQFADNLRDRDLLKNSQDTFAYLASQLSHYPQEIFACLFLDNKNRIICFEKLFFGSVNEAKIYPREIVRKVIQHNAVSIILAHNHPSGVVEPSHADCFITEQICKALAFIDVRVLDHVIIGNLQHVFSFAEHGWL